MERSRSAAASCSSNCFCSLMSRMKFRVAGRPFHSIVTALSCVQNDVPSLRCIRSG